MFFIPFHSWVGPFSSPSVLLSLNTFTGRVFCSERFLPNCDSSVASLKMYRKPVNCVLCYRALSAHMITKKQYHSLGRKRQILHLGQINRHVLVHQQRNVALVARIIRGALKIRYLVLGSAVGGGVQLSRVSIGNHCLKCTSNHVNLSTEIRRMEGITSWLQVDQRITPWWQQDKQSRKKSHWSQRQTVDRQQVLQ